ncbi:hypothetical protein NDU88_002217, partial [Pleurodeles waltl]
QKMDLHYFLGTAPIPDQVFCVNRPHVQVIVFKIYPNNFTGLNITSDSTEWANRHAVSIPSEILKGNGIGNYEQRLICVDFSSSILFQDGKNSSLLNERIVGVTLYNSTVQNLSSNAEIRFWHQQALDETNARCVWWIPGSGAVPGNWSQEGCRTVHQPNLTVCLCNHMTYFAVLLQMFPASLDVQVLTSLTYITYIGCGISAAASLFTILMYIFYRKRKNDDTAKIHMNLVGSIFLLNLCFLTNETLARGSLDTPGLCTAAAVLLHCSLLCCFTWMAIEGFHLYLLLIKVYNIYFRHYLRKLCAVGWGLPISTVIFITIIQKKVYGPLTIATDQGYHNRTMCWVVSRELHYGLNLAYAGLILIFNTVILIIVAKKIQNLQAEKGRACRDTLTVLGLSCLLGTTWGLAYFSFGTFLVPQLYAFSILNSLQGFFILLWYCQIHTRPGDKSESGPTNTTQHSESVRLSQIHLQKQLLQHQEEMTDE